MDRQQIKIAHPFWYTRVDVWTIQKWEIFIILSFFHPASILSPVNDSLIIFSFLRIHLITTRFQGSRTFWEASRDKIVTRLNIMVRYHNPLLRFHLTCKFRWGKYFYVKVFQNNLAELCWRINVMVWYREYCVEMYKPEFKVYRWDFSAKKSQLTQWIFFIYRS